MATECVGTAAVPGKDAATPPSLHLAFDGQRANHSARVEQAASFAGENRDGNSHADVRFGLSIHCLRNSQCILKINLRDLRYYIYPLSLSNWCYSSVCSESICFILW